MKKCKYLIVGKYPEGRPKYTCELVTDNSKVFLDIKGEYEKKYPGCNMTKNGECFFVHQNEEYENCPYSEPEKQD